MGRTETHLLIVIFDAVSLIFVLYAVHNCYLLPGSVAYCFGYKCWNHGANALGVGVQECRTLLCTIIHV